MRIVTLVVFMALTATLVAQDRDTKVRNDLRDFGAADDWIYNDLPRALATAAKSGKPILVVIRCIP